MEILTNEAFEYVNLMWKPQTLTHELIQAHMKPYNEFLESLIPDTVPEPFRKYIHKERLVYDLYMADQILIFRFDPKDFTDETDSFYSNSELEEDEAAIANFVNGVRLMDEFDYREQLSANEFTGGYWDPDHHWVLLKRNFVASKMRKPKRA